MPHTPAPWKLFKIGNVVEVQAKNENNPPNTPPIVHWMGFDDSFREFDEHVANARLIAAAPELLEALEGMILSHGYINKNTLFPEPEPCDCNGCNQARAAIAKAKGQP